MPLQETPLAEWGKGWIWCTRRGLVCQRCLGLRDLEPGPDNLPHGLTNTTQTAAQIPGPPRVTRESHVIFMGLDS